MPTQVLAVGTGAANSSDVIVAAGATLGVALKDAAGSLVSKTAIVDILYKDDAGQYFKVGSLNYGQPAVQIGPGTYRFTRKANGVSVGVFSG